MQEQPRDNGLVRFAIRGVSIALRDSTTSSFFLPSLRSTQTTQFETLVWLVKIIIEELRIGMNEIGKKEGCYVIRDIRARFYIFTFFEL